jgi:hypothetical protein
VTVWRPFCWPDTVFIPVISLVHYIVQAGETADAEAFVRELALLAQHGVLCRQQLQQKGLRRVSSSFEQDVRHPLVNNLLAIH